MNTYIHICCVFLYNIWLYKQKYICIYVCICRIYYKCFRARKTRKRTVSDVSESVHPTPFQYKCQRVELSLHTTAPPPSLSLLPPPHTHTDPVRQHTQSEQQWNSRAEQREMLQTETSTVSPTLSTCRPVFFSPRLPSCLTLTCLPLFSLSVPGKFGFFPPEWETFKLPSQCGSHRLPALLFLSPSICIWTETETETSPRPGDLVCCMCESVMRL